MKGKVKGLFGKKTAEEDEEENEEENEEETITAETAAAGTTETAQSKEEV